MSGTGRYWHWSPEDLVPGTVLQPGAQRPDGGFWRLADWRAERVWLWADPFHVLDFGGADGHIYEVRADASPHTPTDADLDPDSGIDAGMSPQFHAATGVVIARVEGEKLQQLQRKLRTSRREMMWQNPTCPGSLRKSEGTSHQREDG